MDLRAISLCVLLAACSSGGDIKLSTYEEPPALTIIAPTGGSEFDQGTVINFAARVADEADAPENLTLIWSSDVDGELLASGLAAADGTVEFATANLSPGFTHTVSLTAIDSDALTATATVAVSVIELPDAPEISVVQPAPGQAGVEGQEFEFIAQVSDSIDAPESLAVFVETDQAEGRFCAASPDATGKAACTYTLAPGIHVLVFTVEDTEGYTASSTIYFNVVAGSEIDDDGDGWTDTQGDCDDADPSVNPAEAEVENGIDDDCDSLVDEGTRSFDDDGDGFTENAGDCDDGNAAIQPLATEVCGNTIDENCDSSLEEEDAIGCSEYYYDYDTDGYGTTNKKCLCSADGYYTARNADDCYDYNASVNPSQAGYFTSQRGDGSHDYDCDTLQSKLYSSAGDCSGAVWVCFTTSGWNSSVPSCGTSGQWINDCSGFSCSAETSSKNQECK